MFVWWCPWQQTIVGSSLSLSGVEPFYGFGATLASGVDVDGNTYNGDYTTRIVLAILSPCIVTLESFLLVILYVCF